jgi:Protein of unknown function (DUF5818)
MKHALPCLLALAALSAGPAGQTFTGTITDSECDRADHSRMQMGPTDAACAEACIDAHGAAWVLYDGQAAYALSDQASPAKFAGQRVRITGTLDAASKTIRVETIAAGQ